MEFLVPLSLLRKRQNLEPWNGGRHQGVGSKTGFLVVLRHVSCVGWQIPHCSFFWEATRATAALSGMEPDVGLHKALFSGLLFGLFPPPSPSPMRMGKVQLERAPSRMFSAQVEVEKLRKARLVKIEEGSSGCRRFAVCTPPKWYSPPKASHI